MMKKIAIVLLFTAVPLFCAQHKTTQLPLSFNEAEKIIEAIYADIDESPYSIKSEEVDTIRQKGGDSTYGEILAESVNDLIEHAKFTAKDTFYDFGCGRGKACMQIALQTPATVVGVDLSSTRIAIANRAKQLLKEKYQIDVGKRLTYKQESFITTELAPKNAVIYACATCFPEKLMKEIGDKIAAHPTGARLYTLKQIPGKTKSSELIWKMSWSSSTTCYYYDLRHKESSRKIKRMKKVK
jgi:SAM-dependent methyltransferase